MSTQQSHGATPHPTCKESLQLQATRLRVMANYKMGGDEAGIAALLAGAEAIEILKQILQDLPAKRDWLDPVLEARAKEVVNG